MKTKRIIIALTFITVVLIASIIKESTPEVSIDYIYNPPENFTLIENGDTLTLRGVYYEQLVHNDLKDKSFYIEYQTTPVLVIVE